ncbi:dihydrofolate reductase family protein [Streptomyces sp. NBC_00513]|uniref:dihydrofolate reductase family protein n=1 Tax=unclassified Streptomyces TaxID=2593676 RepID=UPI00224D94E8|nr:dihydrofolate reductase family protein [Streptomyces sp. NBC_00424]MCX5073430.1 dihydrofolate reductase family protein [Streptomyces sp. NBC_00424]WUD43310.1 dihydrofolate reductase family protein [Streptomyces sp. NBC_00513]
MRKLTYYLATSVDGFIADPDGDGDFFNKWLDPEYSGAMFAEFPETVPTHVQAALGLGLDPGAPRRFDAIVMGRGTYDPAYDVGITSPYAHLDQYVASRSLTESPDPAVEIISGDVAARVRELKARPGLGIYLCGGADLAGQLVEEIDEFVVKTYPVFVGSGIPMSRAGFALRELELTDVRSFTGGQVVTTYARRR